MGSLESWCHNPNPILRFVTMTDMLISSLNLVLTRTNLTFYKSFPLSYHSCFFTILIQWHCKIIYLLNTLILIFESK